MPEDNTSNTSELFRNLSEKEQENLVAGEAKIFFQQTNIQTTADNTLNLGGGDISSQKTTYNSSQTTIGSSLEFGLPNSTNPSYNRWINFLGNILRNLFS